MTLLEDRICFSERLMIGEFPLLDGLQRRPDDRQHHLHLGLPSGSDSGRDEDLVIH